MLEAVLFYLFAAAMVGSALAILLSRNIVRSAIWLLATLGAAAGLYFLLAANFLAVVQLIVYAGGILVLIVFGVMLTARQPQYAILAKPREIVLAAGIAAILGVALIGVMLTGPWPPTAAPGPDGPMVNMQAIGHELLTTYLVPFEVASILLLAVMIGAAYLARPQKR